MGKSKKKMQANEAWPEQKSIYSRSRENKLNSMITPIGFASLSADKKREQSWREYGYPDSLEFSDFYNLYRRNSLASGAIGILTDKCWQTYPKGVKEISDSIWAKFKDLDIKRLVGRYAGLILEINDNRALSQPVLKGKELVGVTPVWQDQLKPKYTKEGELFWEYTCLSTKENLESTETIRIHSDRVFALGDITNSKRAFLEPIYNDFVNIEKIKGGGGEGFFKNSARQLAITMSPEIRLKDLNNGKTSMREAINEMAYALNTGQDTAIGIQGGNIQTLTTSIPDPTPHFEINMQSIASHLGISKSVLVGNITGERASSEDMQALNEKAQGRRFIHLTPDIQSFIDKLIYLRIIRRKNIEIEWDDLSDSTAKEKLELALKAVQINQANFGEGEPVFTTDEIRELAGYEAKPSPFGEAEARIQGKVGQGDPEEEEEVEH